MTVTIADYNPEWPKMYEHEVASVMKAFPINDCLVEHVGSTSIKDLKSKPVIDIMVGVPALPDDITPIADYLKPFGYEYMERYNKLIPERRFFQKEQNGVRTHQIHLTSFHSDFWEKLLFFRNQLRENPSLREGYEKVKLELAKRSWDSVNDYASAKDEFVESVDQKRKALKLKMQSTSAGR